MALLHGQAGDYAAAIKEYNAAKLIIENEQIEKVNIVNVLLQLGDLHRKQHKHGAHLCTMNSVIQETTRPPVHADLAPGRCAPKAAQLLWLVSDR
jgi:hypothetical protein